VVPTVCRCAACDENFEPVDVIYACPDCGCLSAEVLAGRELGVDGAGGELKLSYLIPTTIESGPTRCSTRVDVNPTSCIQPWQSRPV